MRIHMLYAYCIRRKESLGDSLQNSFIDGLFGAKVSKNARWMWISEEYKPAPLNFFCIH
jgi:hypothetical protein